MSVRIHWRPAVDQSNYFTSGTSTALGRLQAMFGERIEKDDVRVLRAMTIASNDPFYAEVADIVEQVGAIVFWGKH